MSTRFVLDASAAVHLVMRTPAAPWLLEGLQAAKLVVAPSLFLSETANALWKYVVHGQLTADEATQHYEEASFLIDYLEPDVDLALEALSAAVRYRHPVYDMLYAVLARRDACSVMTMDRRLEKIAVSMDIGVYGPRGAPDR